MNRGTAGNLVASLAAFAVFMVVLLSALGFGVGIAELGIWTGLFVMGVVLIVRRFQGARAAQ